MSEYTISFTEEEFNVVRPQIGSRLADLNKLLCNAGKQGDSDRVVEISKFIKSIESFQTKMLTAYTTPLEYEPRIRRKL